jgi:hypothetical protein
MNPAHRTVPRHAFCDSVGGTLKEGDRMSVEEFAREQAVQEAIGYIQKISGESILGINEAVIRLAVDRGTAPSVIARRYLATARKATVN